MMQPLLLPWLSLCFNPFNNHSNHSIHPLPSIDRGELQCLPCFFPGLSLQHTILINSLLQFSINSKGGILDPSHHLTHVIHYNIDDSSTVRSRLHHIWCLIPSGTRFSLRALKILPFQYWCDPGMQ